MVTGELEGGGEKSSQLLETDETSSTVARTDGKGAVFYDKETGTATVYGNPGDEAYRDLPEDTEIIQSGTGTETTESGARVNII